MLSQRRRRLSVLSSTCQHVATLQFVSGAETNSEPFPDLILVFYVEGEIDWDCGFALESLPVKTGICILLRHQCFAVVAQATPQDLQRQPNGYFRMKDVDRRFEVIAQVKLSSTFQHVATLQFVSGAETDKFRAFSRPHPCFLRWRWDCMFALESLPAKTGICILLRHQCFSVVAQATPQDSPKASPRLFSNERRG